MDDRILVAGLGNPGLRYTGTRHNFGFLVVDGLRAAVRGSSWKKGFSGMYCSVEIAGRPCLILKPMTFMNSSGRSVREAIRFYGIGSDDIIVVHDDVDFQLGTLRVKKGGGAGGHRGVESCARELGNTDFIRLRMGVGRPVDTDEDVTDYVLSKFTEHEEETVAKMIAAGVEAVESIIARGVSAAMNELNRRNSETD